MKFYCHTHYESYVLAPVDFETLEAINIKNSNNAHCIRVLSDRTVYFFNYPEIYKHVIIGFLSKH